MYEAVLRAEKLDPGELGMLSQMLVSRASGRGEQPLMAEVGLDLGCHPIGDPAGACRGTPAGSRSVVS